jgi:hypothetical protein
MRNVFVRTDFRVLHRRAESVGRSDRPANRGFRLLVVVQQREQRGLTLRQASLSIRDIGSARGLSRGTVQRELDAADPASLPNTIVGADGKERSASCDTARVCSPLTGATLRELMARLGHTSPNTAMRYQHVAEGRAAALADRLSALATTP